MTKYQIIGDQQSQEEWGMKKGIECYPLKNFFRNYLIPTIYFIVFDKLYTKNKLFLMLTI